MVVVVVVVLIVVVVVVAVISQKCLTEGWFILNTSDF